MTSYNGQSITYDEIGNPLTYRDGMTMTWTGRQLTTLTQNGKQNTYKYDVDGLRLEKTAGGVTTQYQYVNGQLLGEKRSNGVILRYTYDALGALSGIQYKNTAGVTTNYIVRCTLSGDVDQIYDTKGNLLARYIYDTWGNTLSVTDASGKAITDPLHIANINPIRYRGYYYDAETGLYYLQSRYYDTTTRRFLNADTLLGANAGAAYNLFAYCGNNPVNAQDSNGQYPIEIDDNPTLRPAATRKKPQIRYGITYSTGAEVTATFGIWSMSAQFGVAIDRHGNVAIQASYSAAATTSVGCSALVGSYSMITNANSVRNLSGSGYNSGASITEPVIGALAIGGGGDWYALPVPGQKNRFYNGLGSFIGIGTGAGGEIHTGWSDTNNVFVFNIFKLLDKIKS